MLVIDGSYGEGGGQILRTTLALSLVTGKPFRIENIRAGRKKPGLLRQHLTAVNAAASIGQAAVVGASLGSQQLTFEPGEVVPGDYAFAVGTAGSATLVLQTILPPLLTASGPSALTLEGGTHNPFAPPFDFLAKVFLPLINTMGPQVLANLQRPGFYPAGGGKFQVAIRPSGGLTGFDLLERGEIRRRQAKAIVAGLPRHIAERELKVIQQAMKWDRTCLTIEELPGSPGPGNVVTVELGSEHVTEVFTGFGQRGLKAETVADGVVQAARRYLAADVPVGEHLADQLLVPLALAGRGSFKTLPPTSHTKTNLEVLKHFLPIDISLEQVGEHACLVKLS